MNGVNQVNLLGTVGKDAEVTVFGETSQVTKFSLAINNSYKNKAGEKVTDTEWIDVQTFFASKYAGEYVKKGSLVYVTGRLKTEKWTDKKDGTPRQRVVVDATSVQVVSKANTPSNGEAKADANTAKKQTEEYAATSGSAGFAAPEENDLPF